MIPKSGYRFSEKIMRQQKLKRDDDSKKNHRALGKTDFVFSYGSSGRLFPRNGRPAFAFLTVRLDGQGLATGGHSRMPQPKQLRR